MTKTEFYNLFDKGPVLVDGATGTNLMAAGMPMGACPEQWVLENPDVILKLQRSYVEAGSDIVYAPTFTGNRIKLAGYGLDNQIEEINTKLVHLSKEAVDGKALVAGDISMTGEQLYPIGDMEFDELVDVYAQQAKILDAAGVDLFVVETMMSVQECRAAMIGIKQVSKLPVIVSLTYESNGRTLYGTPADVATVVLQSMGADAIGINCSTGPQEMVDLVKSIAAVAKVPILAKPNAGIPEMEGDRAVYKMEPDEFAQALKGLVEAGAAMVGGCCGTRPDHIAALSAEVSGMAVSTNPSAGKRPTYYLTTERALFALKPEGEPIVIGNGINASADEDIQQMLEDEAYDEISDYALDQLDDGASVININIAMDGIDEVEALKEVVFEISSSANCPICIESKNAKAIEESLKNFAGRAIVKSVSTSNMEELLPIVKAYGAMAIITPDKKEDVDAIVDRAVELGIAREAIIVDGVVTPIITNATAVQDCIEMVSYAKEKDLATVLEISNISKDHPVGEMLNVSLFEKATEAGVTFAIANASEVL